jgi:hypothetical protein
MSRFGGRGRIEEVAMIRRGKRGIRHHSCAITLPPAQSQGTEPETRT